MRMAGKTHGEKRGKKWKPLMSAIDILCVYVSVCLCVCVSVSPTRSCSGRLCMSSKGKTKSNLMLAICILYPQLLEKALDKLDRVVQNRVFV